MGAVSNWGLKPSLKGCRGSVFIETALTFPFLFAVVLIFLWTGYIYNAKNGLVSAIGNGARLAFTRGDVDKSGLSGLLPEVDNWYYSSAAFPELLSNQDDKAAALAAYNQNLSVEYSDPLYTIDNAPLSYLYAIVYTVQAMKETVGAVNYPCLRDDEIGCLTCYPANPLKHEIIKGQNGFGLSCEYRPSGLFIDPIMGMIKYMTGDGSSPKFTIKKTSFF